MYVYVAVCCLYLVEGKVLGRKSVAGQICDEVVDHAPVKSLRRSSLDSVLLSFFYFALSEGWM